MDANNDAVPPRVLKSVAFVDTVVRRWYWSSSVWIYILAYVLYTLPFCTCTPNIFEIGYICAVCMFEFAVNTSGKAGAHILHLPLGDDSSPSGDRAVSL
jgi:hypothetical protein